MKQKIQPLTPEKLNRVKFSLQKMAILVQILLMENQTEIVDADFRIPNLNNFARRILSDSKALKNNLHTSGRINVKIVDTDFAEDYSGEI